MPEPTTTTPPPADQPTSATPSSGQGQGQRRRAQAEGTPTTREEFQTQLLASICDTAPAENGAILRVEQRDAVQMMAIYPPLEDDNTAPPWLSQAADHVPTVADTGVSQIVAMKRGDELYGQKPTDFLAVIPLTGGSAKPEVAAFRFHVLDLAEVTKVRDRIELTTKLLGVYDMQNALRMRSVNLGRMRTSMEIVGQLTEHQRFRPAAMALCNEVAAKWGAERVSLGVLRGRYVKIRAISHTDRFTRKMRLVQDLESVMEECFDQDVEVVYPAPPDAPFVNRAAAQSSTRHGPVAVASIPLRQDGEPKAVLTVERNPDKPFTVNDIETLRLLGDLCAGSLLYLHEHDRWTGAKVAADLRQGLKALVGPRHTWLKLLIVGLLFVIILTTVLESDYSVESPFVIEPPELSVVSAPFNGQLRSVHVQPDDIVVKGQLLAQFDVADLDEQLAELRAEREEYIKSETKARSERKMADALVAVAQRNRVDARMRLLASHRAKASITAPRDGRVLTGDLERHINRQYEMGEVLFEIAPAEDVHAELSVPEKRIGDLLIERNRRAIARWSEDLVAGGQAENLEAAGQWIVQLQSGDPDQHRAQLEAYIEKTMQTDPLRGELATTANPGRYIPFVIERIDPVAEVDKQTTVFRVHVRLKTDDPQILSRLKRGMSGTAKVDIDQRSYLEIWTRDLVNWVRMTLWI